ncbi:hypothetical protein [Azospirillum rugosum]|uniref:Uncharacterized protein n=1 Tax=Azospirillum rugosum TaxID=416170 RepID=A0ABS4SG28_9PROT|nr:hypothetical protein [Azospirillum rugosum]MBP2291523.1 hypothetical protein [Azospirillum rugosum]MDQ0525311.1 hypothetical protein [Azospirillum rugosum]
MHHPEALEPIVAFVRGLGMGVEYGEGARDGFLPGINIHAGVIHIDPDTLLAPGDILHEAGHIIVVPRRYWPRLGRDLQADIEGLVAEQSGEGQTPDPLLVRAVQQGEQMATAWSYAVVHHLGLPQECLFFPGSYRVGPYEGVHPFQAWIEQGSHFGPLCLAQADMTGYSGLFAYMGNNGLPPFPHMTRWTVD